MKTGISDVQGRMLLPELPAIFKRFLDDDSFVLGVFGRPGTGKRYLLEKALHQVQRPSLLLSARGGDEDLIANDLFETLKMANDKVVIINNANSYLDKEKTRSVLLQSVEGRISNPRQSASRADMADLHCKIILLDDPYSKTVRSWNTHIPGYRYSWTVTDLIAHCRSSAKSICKEAKCDESALTQVLEVYETAIERGLVNAAYAGEHCGISFSVAGVIKSCVEYSESGKLGLFSCGQHFAPVIKNLINRS